MALKPSMPCNDCMQMCIQVVTIYQWYTHDEFVLLLVVLRYHEAAMLCGLQA